MSALVLPENESMESSESSKELSGVSGEDILDGMSISLNDLSFEAHLKKSNIPVVLIVFFIEFAPKIQNNDLLRNSISTSID